MTGKLLDESNFKTESMFSFGRDLRFGVPTKKITAPSPDKYSPMTNLNQNAGNPVMLTFWPRTPFARHSSQSRSGRGPKKKGTKHRQRTSLKTLVLLLQDSHPLSALAR